MTSLTDLLVRLEAAEGADRALDYVIHGEIVLGHRVVPGGVNPPNYTASLEAALALVERVLPGWLPSVEKRRGLNPAPDGAYVIDLAGRPAWEVWTARMLRTSMAYHDANAKTPALAVCAALLKALIAKEEASAATANTDFLLSDWNRPMTEAPDLDAINGRLA